MHESMAQYRCLYISPNVMKNLEQAVLGAGEEAEVCGLLEGYLKDTEAVVVTAVRPLSNLSLLKCSFAVDVEEFCRERDAIEDAGLVLLALYHSHPNGSTQFSFRDRELPRITDLPLLILAWDKGMLRLECWGDVDNKMVPISVVPYYDPEIGC